MREPDAGDVPTTHGSTDAGADTVPGGGQARTAKGGRDLPAAIGIGLVLAVLAIGSLFWQPWLFAVLVSVAVVVATLELRAALSTVGVLIPRLPVIVGGVAAMATAYLLGAGPVLAVVGLAAVAVAIWRTRGPVEGYLRDVTAGVFVLVYVVLAASFAVLIVTQPDGPWRVLIWLVAVVASDVGGFAAGVTFGKHPMAPKISPKKSWEGFAGSVVFSLVAATVGIVVVLDGPVWVGLVFGVAMVLTATLGDLVESLVKRDIGVKDMGTLLPGHGGAMDRLDSIVLSAPVAWVVYAALLGV